MFSSCAPLTFEALPSTTCGVGRFRKSIVVAALTRSMPIFKEIKRRYRVVLIRDEPMDRHQPRKLRSRLSHEPRLEQLAK